MRLLFVFIGMVLILFLYIVGVTLVVKYASGDPHNLSQCILPQALVVCELIFMSAAFFVCSMLTGLMVKPYIEKTFSEILYSSPGLYCFLIASLVLILYGQFNILFWLTWLGIWVLWVLASYTGVALGYKLRAKFSDLIQHVSFHKQLRE